MKRNFLFLAALTLAAVLAVFLLVPGGESPGESPGGDLLLPEVAGQINAVDTVEIVAAGERPVATLHKAGDHWQVQHMYGYRADWPAIRSMLAALAQARVVESKTDKPGYYARLGVEDISSPGASGVLVRLGIEGQMTGVIVGKRAQGREGQYLRLLDSTGSVLVDRVIDVADGEMDWVDSRIIDISSAEVAEVEIIHPGGERVLITRISADQTDFDLVGLPDGRETASSWAVNSLASTLSVLDMEAVRPAGELDWTGAARMRLLAFSGVEVMVDLMKYGDEYLLRLEASHPAAAVVVNEPPEVTGDSASDDIEKRAMEDIARLVNDINQKVSAWVYTIAEYKYQAMVKKPEDLLKPLEN